MLFPAFVLFVPFVVAFLSLRQPKKNGHP